MSTSTKQPATNSHEEKELLPYLIAAVKRLEKNAVAMYDIRSNLHNTAVKITLDQKCDLADVRELGTKIVRDSQNQGYEFDQLFHNLGTIKHILKRLDNSDH